MSEEKEDCMIDIEKLFEPGGNAFAYSGPDYKNSSYFVM